MKYIFYLLLISRISGTLGIDDWESTDSESHSDDITVDGWLLVNEFATNMTLPINSTKSRMKLWRNSLPPPGKNYSSALDESVKGIPHAIQSVIEADVKRSGIGMAFSGKYDWLEDVLKAYAKRNPSVGYCQGMNYIAAQFIIIGFNPEEAYNGLAFLVETVAVNYHSVELSGFLEDVKIIQIVIDAQAPSLASSMKELVDEEFKILETLLLDTSLSLFARSLPPHALLPVWDIIFSHGRKGLISVSAALVLMFSDCFDAKVSEDSLVTTLSCYSTSTSRIPPEKLTDFLEIVHRVIYSEQLRDISHFLR
jgi:Rab-GTPase-TBC domain